MIKDRKQVLSKLAKLKKERNSLILAHNYQDGEIQDVADYVGDSYGLSRIAQKAKENCIVLCGVHFMAESVALLAPEKTVILPEILAGCPMADMVTVEALREKKNSCPDACVVAYVNTSAAVKAESDVCVTSSNAVKVVNSLEADEILFIPDRNLADYVSKRTNKKIIPWDGYCPTHDRVTIDEVKKCYKLHPDALIIVHPECNPDVVEASDGAFSTSGILKFIRQSKHHKFIIGTEVGLLHRLRKENPDKELYLLSQGLFCPNMKYTTLEKLIHSLETMHTIIEVPANVQEGAKKALERMLEITGDDGVI